MSRGQCWGDLTKGGDCSTAPRQLRDLGLRTQRLLVALLRFGLGGFPFSWGLGGLVGAGVSF